LSGRKTLLTLSLLTILGPATNSANKKVLIVTDERHHLKSAHEISEPYLRKRVLKLFPKIHTID
jgi:hypothetical protein